MSKDKKIKPEDNKSNQANPNKGGGKNKQRKQADDNRSKQIKETKDKKK